MNKEGENNVKELFLFNAEQVIPPPANRLLCDIDSAKTPWSDNQNWVEENPLEASRGEKKERNDDTSIFSGPKRSVKSLQ